MSIDDGDDKDDDISLTCPITHELFRDPVKDNDGHLYEREAITRWINEKGTSPFTRQPLSINQLQPDEEIKKRANHRRILLVTYNRNAEQVQLPRIQLDSSIRRANRVADITYNPERINRCPCYRNRRCTCPDIRYGVETCCDSVRDKISACLLLLCPCAPVIVVVCCIACIVVATVVPIVVVYGGKQTSFILATQVWIPYTYTSRPPVCHSVNQAFVTNLCIASFTNITVIEYVTCNDFSYQAISYGFNAISFNTTIIFAFEQTFGYWDIDNITVWNSNTSQNIFQNGDFESGSLSPNYRTCQSSGYISNSSQFNGRYCFSDNTNGQYGYLMQSISTNIGIWYYLKFYLQNRNGPGSNYAILLGSS